MIDRMTRIRYPGLVAETSRHGKRVYYVRRGKGRRYPVQGEPGTPQFNAAYQAAMAACRAGEAPGEGAPQTVRFAPGTLGWAVQMYRASLEWAELAQSTRAWRGRYLDEMVQEHGARPVRTVTAVAIKKGLDRRGKAMAPATANMWLKTIKGFFAWCETSGLVKVSPAQRVKGLTNTSDGFEPWTDADREAFRAHWPYGTQQRLCFELALATLARRKDLVALGRQHRRMVPVMLDGEERMLDAILFTPQKTSHHQRPVEVAALVSPELDQAIQALPIQGLTFLARPDGMPRSDKALGNWFREACDAAGIPKGRSLHGIRKRQAERLAERGATESQLQAMGGWKSLAQPAHYTRKADRRGQALAASALLLDEPTSNKNPSPNAQVRGKHRFS